MKEQQLVQKTRATKGHLTRPWPQTNKPIRLENGEFVDTIALVEDNPRGIAHTFVVAIFHQRKELDGTVIIEGIDLGTKRPAQIEIPPDEYPILDNRVESWFSFMAAAPA